MKTMQLLATTLTVILLCPAMGYALLNEELINHCENKTKVYNRHGDHIGEKPNDYCAGYLQSTLDALRDVSRGGCESKG